MNLVTATYPYPQALFDAVHELRHYPGWMFHLQSKSADQGCSGLSLLIYPDHADAYHPENHVRTCFPFVVPPAAYNRESWEEWIWYCLQRVDDHERSEHFRFVSEDGTERRPFKPAHADGWDFGVVRSCVNETVVNTPNAGRRITINCEACDHRHWGTMGEHFEATMRECPVDGCQCQVGKPVPSSS